MAGKNEEKGTKQMKAVYTIQENGEKSRWTQIGVAFVNRDESLNILLDALPKDGRLHVRDFSEKTAQE